MPAGPSPSGTTAPPSPAPPSSTELQPLPLAAHNGPAYPAQPSRGFHLASSFTLGIVGAVCRAAMFGGQKTEVHGLQEFLGLLDRRRDVEGRERGLITGMCVLLSSLVGVFLVKDCFGETEWLGFTLCAFVVFFLWGFDSGVLKWLGWTFGLLKVDEETIRRVCCGKAFFEVDDLKCLFEMEYVRRSVSAAAVMLLSLLYSYCRRPSRKDNGWLMKF